MDLNKLVQELQSIDKSITEAEVKQWMVDSGRSLGSITTNDLLEIAAAIKSGSAGKLATAPKAGAATRSDRKRSKAKPPTFDQALIHLAGQAEQDFQAIESEASTSVRSYVKGRAKKAANELVQEIADAPGLMLEEIAAAALEHRADPEFFRSEARSAFSVAFPSVEPVASAE